MAGCKVNPDASPQFAVLREYWKKHGYPSICTDLDEAFREIAKEIQACHCVTAQRFSEVLEGFALHKYRYRNKAAREGAKGGWRFYALYDKATQTLYPIVVYPKKAWTDASDDSIQKAIQEIVNALRAAK